MEIPKELDTVKADAAKVAAEDTRLDSMFQQFKAEALVLCGTCLLVGAVAGGFIVTYLKHL